MPVVDKTKQIEKELSELQSKLDRITYLLKIADPRGDAAKKREANGKIPKLNQPVLNLSKQPQPKQKKSLSDAKPMLRSPLEKTSHSAQVDKSKCPEEVKDTCEKKEKKPPVYSVTKPQWLGDTKNVKLEEDNVQEAVVEVPESDSFVDYKDRKKVLASANNAPDLEHAAPGLIIRKRKSVEKPEDTVDKAPRMTASSSSEAETSAADTVALLLKHKRGYIALDEELRNENQQSRDEAPGKEASQPRRVLGPAKPDFLDKSRNYETWVPPEGIERILNVHICALNFFIILLFLCNSDSCADELIGQTGDGRTSLNDRLGY